MPARYRLAWGLWIAGSAIDIEVYLLLTNLRSHGTHGLLLVSAIALQALLVPAYILRARFHSHADAAIRSASAAVTLAGVSVLVFLLAEPRFHSPRVLIDPGFQAGYVVTILIVAGASCGVVLGLVRWGLTPASDIDADARASGWSRYRRAALIWIATVTMCCWMYGAAKWGAGGADLNGMIALGLFATVTGLVGIAPIPALFSTPRSASRARRASRYGRLSMIGMAVLWIAAIAFSFAAQSVLAVYLIASVLYLPLFWALCWTWALLYGFAEPRAIAAGHTGATPRRVISWIAAAQAVAALLALQAATPPALGPRGIGCVTNYTSNAAEYRFWEAYKGLGVVSRSDNRLIVRPSIDRTVCIVIDQPDMAFLQDPRQLTWGYAQAARSWYWLIDPDDWDGARTKEIRQTLAGLIGRDFPSYRDLQDWWTANGDALVWSGAGTRLDARPKTPKDLAHPRTSPRMQYPNTSPSAVEIIHRRQSVPDLESGPSRDDEGSGRFRAALLDREARLRGLTLATADAIDVLSGEHDREARAFLERIAGPHPLTRAQWQAAFDSPQQVAPWRMSRTSADEWIGLIADYGRTEPYRTHYLERLRSETGLFYSTPEAYLPWLQNPDNTRQDEWLKARDLLSSLPDDRDPENQNRLAMDWLKRMTTETFTSAREWIEWWQTARGHLALSGDALRLVRQPAT